jgi:hypothetical protein
MTHGVMKLQHDGYQAPIWFRGYTETYIKNHRVRMFAPTVRKTYALAETDAKALLKLHLKAYNV